MSRKGSTGDRRPSKRSVRAAEPAVPTAAGPAPSPVATLREAVFQVTESGRLLEQSWSDALDSVVGLPEARNEFRAQLGAIGSVLQREVESEVDTLRRLGYDTRMDFAWPMPAELLARLIAGVGAEGEFRRLAAARQLALLDFLETSGAIFEKPNMTLREGDSVKRWWSSGAFMLIQEKAGLLLRLHEDAQRFVEELSQSTTPSGSRVEREVVADLEQSRHLIGIAQPEAALTHMLRALRARFLAAGEATATAAELPVSVLASECPSLLGIAKALSEAEETLAQGPTSFTLAKATLLAYGLHDAIVRAVMSPNLDEYRIAVEKARG